MAGARRLIGPKELRMNVLARWGPPILSTRRWRLLVALPLVVLLLAIWACGFSISPRPGARPLPTADVPDAGLRLAIQITGQYRGAAPIVMTLRIFEGTDGREVALANDVRVACNGKVAARNPLEYLRLICERERPGNSYQVAFTDGRGRTTTVNIPVPPGDFAFVSPRAGATVPIPTDGALVVRYTMPLAPANGKVAVDSLTATCARAGPYCGAVYANLQPSQQQGTPTPDPRQPTATPFEIHVAPTPTPGPNDGGTPVPVYTPIPTIGPPTPTVSVTQNGQTGVIYLTGDYSAFVPAPGSLSMSVEVDEAPDPGGFAAVSVTYLDAVDASITWTR